LGASVVDSRAFRLVAFTTGDGRIFVEGPVDLGVDCFLAFAFLAASVGGTAASPNMSISGSIGEFTELPDVWDVPWLN
jgi:hypothetical protein